MIETQEREKPMQPPLLLPLADQRCLCGHLLRSDQERKRGRCIECELQEHMNENQLFFFLTYAKEQDRSCQPVAHMMRKAITAEREAMSRFSKERNGDETGWLSAYDLCEALNCVANALSHWAYVAARLWHALELTREDQDLYPYLCMLHTWSTGQSTRLLSIHLAMQARVQVFCQEYGISPHFQDR